MDMAKLMEAKEAWTLYNLMVDLQERLWQCYETDFRAFMKQDYTAFCKMKSAEK